LKNGVEMNEKQSGLFTWLAIILIAMVAILTLAPEETEEDDSEWLQPYSEIVADDVVAISLTSIQGLSTELVKEEDVWMVENPHQHMADQEIVASLIARLSSIECSSPLSENENLADFGLDSPVWSISTTDNSQKTKSLLVGNNTVSGQQTYVICDQEPHPRATRLRLEVESEYRSREIVDLTLEDVNKIQILNASQNETTTLSIGEYGWLWNQEDNNVLADKDEIYTLLSMLSEARVEHFANQTIGENHHVVVLHHDEQSTTIKIDRSGIAIVPLQPNPVTLDSDIFEQIIKSDWSSKQLFSMELESLSEIEFAFGETKLNTSKTSTGWEPIQGESLLAALDATRVNRMADVPTAVGEPWGNITVNGISRLNVYQEHNEGRVAKAGDGVPFLIPYNELSKLDAAATYIPENNY